MACLSVSEDKIKRRKELLVFLLVKCGPILALLFGMTIHRQRGGQAVTELALMLPLIFALVFAVIEFSYYLGGVHYVNYATFMGARAVQANESPADVESELLTGNVTNDAYLVTLPSGSGVTGTLPWEAQMPGFAQVMGQDMTVDMTVSLGKPECQYEGRNVSGLTGEVAAAYSDNRLECN